MVNPLDKIAFGTVGAVVLWDYFTTAMGVAAFFPHRSLLLWIFSFVCSLGLSGYLLSTFRVFRIPGGFPKSFALGLWTLFFAFDIYTTFVGHAAVVSENPFTMTIVEFLNSVQEMTVGQLGAIGLTTLFVVTCVMLAANFLSNR